MEEIDKLRKLLKSKISKGFRSEASKPFRSQKTSKRLGNSKNHPKSKILECAQKSKAFPTFQSKIKREAEKNIELDDSDIPIHEKFVKEEHIKELKKSKRKLI